MSTQEPQARLQADSSLVGLTVLWGTTFAIVKGALGDADPFTFLALRFIVGATVLSVLAGRRLLNPLYLRRGVVLGLFLFTGFALQTVGLTRTTPSRSAFITGLYVLMVPGVMLALFRKVPRVSSLAGVVLSAMGLYYLTGTDVGAASFALGDWLSLGCAVGYAFHICFTDRYAPKENARALVAIQLWVVALLSLLCRSFVETHVVWTPAFVGAVLFCGVFASALALSVQTWAQARTSAVRAAIIYSLEPVLAAVFSVLLGYERLGTREWLGGGLIVTGVLVAELGSVLWERWRARRAARVVG